MLFLELALIRWTAANIVHLGYFSNFVLLGSFLGVGVGFLRVGRTSRAPLYFPVCLALLVAAVLRFPVTVDRSGSDLIFFTSLHTSGPPPWLALPLVFVGVAVVMAGPGELVGRCFTQLGRLDAYRLDLLGSLIGIGAFTALSLLRAPSVAWGVVVAVTTGVLLWRPRRAALLVVCGAALVAMLGIESLAPGVSWSPYYKVSTTERIVGGHRVISVSVNGVPHQAAMDAETKAKCLADGFELAGANPWRVFHVAEQAQKYNPRDLPRAIAAARDAYLRCVSSALAPRVIIEELLLRVIATPATTR